MCAKGPPTPLSPPPLFAGRFVTRDEILRGAIEVAMAGADSVLTPRSMEVVELLVKEGLCVQRHVGKVPSTASRHGGMRTLGKTATEALVVLDAMRRLHAAGAYGCEVECVAADALAAISKHSPLVTNSNGAGAAGDVIFLFLADICGETESPPRHAKSSGDGAAIRRQLDAERRRAVTGFRCAVQSGT